MAIRVMEFSNGGYKIRNRDKYREYPEKGDVVILVDLLVFKTKNFYELQ